MTNKWIFIIDTDAYAGNFERDMCAYLTGVIGDCEVGEEFAELYNKEVNTDGLESVFIEYLEHRPDEHGCARPCSLWLTKSSNENNSVAIFFDKKPTVKLINLMKERAGKFADAKRQVAKEKGYSWDTKFKLTIHGFRLIKESTTETEETV